MFISSSSRDKMKSLVVRLFPVSRPGMPKMNRPLARKPGRVNLAHRIAHRLQGYAGLVALHHRRIGRFDAKRYHQCPGLA